MIYASPGSAEALVTFKDIYGNYIGGRFVEPVRVSTSTMSAP